MSTPNKSTPNKLGLTITIPKTVFSYPCNYSIDRFVPLTVIKDKCGMDASMVWQSADGDLTHLTGVYSNELISAPIKATGCFANVGFHVSSKVDTYLGQSNDEHGFPAQMALNGPGEMVLYQVFVYGFKPWTVAPCSGFQITHSVEDIGNGKFKVTTTKEGKAVRFRHSINASDGIVVEEPVEYSSEAGQGRAIVVQIVQSGGINPAILVKADLCIR
ncbi:hypothetical protein EVC45_23695 [Paraburkholderia sp. UYCP14C]|uniref:hypothetical protein n=1 Tax=Paraburkholderia sp. UYCP14C TaxID=2511130 RepID=UPI00101F5641|nr:hypothetical protein [Paraburkholderia sp. UYCP14C]RZF27186.1 hypothetical protein EVC45_23695 [Paraburkholderia sp. UYCP14C]